MSHTDIVSPSDNVKTRRCKDPEYDEEEQVRALLWAQGTGEEDYLEGDEALRIAQLVSGMLVHAEPSSAGTSSSGRMKVM
ncbi:hypothetical protein EI94DRAFT_1819455 [Lactarius quietus]|nr:hypothetical protein EI94DRAFT_1819455 [Lactarius quietus]